MASEWGRCGLSLPGRQGCYQLGFSSQYSNVILQGQESSFAPFSLHHQEPQPNHTPFCFLPQDSGALDRCKGLIKKKKTKLHTLIRELHAMGQERSILSLMYAFYCNFYVPGTVLSFLHVFLTSIIYHISTAKETKAERRGVAGPRSWHEFLCRSAIYIQVCLLRCLCWKPLGL